jgi:hypothetical protein
MSLNSASTLTDAQAQYADNLSWEGSPAKAALALEAIRWLLAFRPVHGEDASSRFDFDHMVTEKARLEAYVQQTASTSTSRRASFVRGRASTW